MEIDERKKVAEQIVNRVRGRVPVVMHIGTANTLSSIELAKHAVSLGVDAVGVVPPYYYPHDDWEVYAHYKAIAQVGSGHADVYLRQHGNHLGRDHAGQSQQNHRSDRAQSSGRHQSFFHRLRQTAGLRLSTAENHRRFSRRHFFSLQRLFRRRARRDSSAVNALSRGLRKNVRSAQSRRFKGRAKRA